MLAKGAAKATLCLGNEKVRLANGAARGMQAPNGTWALLSLNDMVQLACCAALGNERIRCGYC
jgi:hypothetical protein